MRRQLAVTAAFGTLCLAAGCSEQARFVDGAPPTAATRAPGPSASVPASAAPRLAGNTEKVCARVERAGQTFGEAYLAGLKQQIEAATPAARNRARQTIARDVRDYSRTLAELARLATEPALSTALTQMSKQVKVLEGDVRKVNQQKMSALSATIDKACGRG